MTEFELDGRIYMIPDEIFSYILELEEHHGAAPFLPKVRRDRAYLPKNYPRNTRGNANVGNEE